MRWSWGLDYVCGDTPLVPNRALGAAFGACSLRRGLAARAYEVLGGAADVPGGILLTWLAFIFLFPCSLYGWQGCP